MVTFRKHTKEDISLRVKWFNHPDIASTIAGTGSGEYKTSPLREREWFKSYEKVSDKVFFTILFNKIPVGLVGLTDIRDKSAELFIINGEPEYWGKGIGYKAMQFIEKIAQEKGLEKIKLSVVQENKRAINLYLKASYIETKIKDGEVLMEKNI